MRRFLVIQLILVWLPFVVAAEPVATALADNDSAESTIQPLTQSRTDSEILDALGEQSGNALFDLEASLTAETASAEINTDTKPEQTWADNSFDQLELDDILTIAEQQEALPGVGIEGDEELLINSLDESGLMDLEDEIDMWGQDVVEQQDDYQGF